MAKEDIDNNKKIKYREYGMKKAAVGKIAVFLAVLFIGAVVSMVFR